MLVVVFHNFVMLWRDFQRCVVYNEFIMNLWNKFRGLSKGKQIGLVALAVVLLGVGGSGGQSNNEASLGVNNETNQSSEFDASQKSPIDTVETKTEEKTESIPFQQTSLEDPSLSAGSTRVSVTGAKGVRTITYEVKYRNGEEISRQEVSNIITTDPVDQITLIGTKQKIVTQTSGSGCDPNYSGACVPIASDVDCAGGSGNGPAYVAGPVYVIGIDIYKLDADGNGIGCES